MFALYMFLQLMQQVADFTLNAVNVSLFHNCKMNDMKTQSIIDHLATP